MISISIITRFYCINFEFSVPRLNWLGTYLVEYHIPIPGTTQSIYADRIIRFKSAYRFESS